MKAFSGVLIGVVLFIAFIAFWSSATVINAGHRGVVTRMGEVTGRTLDEGFHFISPFVEKVWEIEVRVQKDEVEASAASQDMQEVNSIIALNYHLNAEDLPSFYQTIGIQYKVRIIDPSVQEGFKAVAAQFPVSDLLTNRAEVKKRTLDVLSERLNKYGIIVDDVSIVNFEFSKQFNDAIEAKQVAQQEAERAFYKLEASKKEAEAIRIQANALKQNPDLVQWEAVKKWDGHLPQVTGGAVPFIEIAK